MFREPALASAALGADEKLVSTQQHSIEIGLMSSLRHLLAVHQWFDDVIGCSREHGATVPTMSYISDQMHHRKHVDNAMMEFHKDMLNGRPFQAHALTTEICKSVLIDLGKLDYLMAKEGAPSALKEITHRAQRKFGAMSGDAVLGELLSNARMDDDAFRYAANQVHVLLEKYEQALSLRIPSEIMEEAVLDPLGSYLARKPFDKIRQENFCVQRHTPSSSSERPQTFAERFLSGYNNSPGPGI